MPLVQVQGTLGQGMSFPASSAWRSVTDPVDIARSPLMSTCTLYFLDSVIRITLLTLCDYSIRLAPPLVISEEDLTKSIQIIKESLEELDTVR